MKTPAQESRTPFTDRFFTVIRRVTHFTLGNDFVAIFENMTCPEMNNGDACRLLDAVGINNHHGKWCIGIFTKPTVVQGQTYPKNTVAVFQGKTPGCRFALFSTDEQ